MVKKTATIIDVARAVGVSPSTVSHAISGKREISTAVKHRVFEKIRELDYRPSFFARALKNSSTGLIGVAANECRNPGATMFLDELSAELEKHSYETVIGLAGLDHAKGREMLRRFSSGLVDGVINLLPQIDPDEAQLICGPVPVVTNIREKSVPVRIDYEGVTRDILTYLRSMGHRQIGYITSPFRMAGTDTTIAVMADFLREHNMPFDPDLVVEGADTIESGIAGAGELFRRKRPSAIFTGNDQMAFGVYRWAYENDVAIPTELSVVGYDDVPQAAFIIPPLTTVHFPVREVVGHAVRLLLARLHDEELNCSELAIKPQLILRKSVAHISAR